MNRAKLSDTERSALASAYIACVIASCESTTLPEKMTAQEETARIAARLGVPRDVFPVKGEMPPAILLRFAKWLETDAIERERKAQAFR